MNSFILESKSVGDDSSTKSDMCCVFPSYADNSLLHRVRNVTDLNVKRTLNKIKELRSFGYTGQPRHRKGQH